MKIELGMFLLGIAVAMIVMLLYSYREIPVVCPKCGDKTDFEDVTVRCRKCKNLFKYKESKH